MTSSLTAGQLLDMARIEHPAFSQLFVEDGALLAALDTRQRALLLRYSGGAIDGLSTTTVTLATTFSGVLLGVTANGTPVYGTTYQDGWPVHLSALGTPYIDITEPMIAGDPFGEHGGTPGFPLPTDFIKMVSVALVYVDNRLGPVEVIAESARLDRQRPGRPTAFVSGNRLVPVRLLATGNTADPWSVGIASIQLAYVAFPRLASLSDLITLPGVLTHALVAQLAAYMARLSPGLSAAEKSVFSTEAANVVNDLENVSVSVLDAVGTSSVKYRS